MRFQLINQVNLLNFVYIYTKTYNFLLTKKYKKPNNFETCYLIL